MNREQRSPEANGWMDEAVNLRPRCGSLGITAIDVSKHKERGAEYKQDFLTSTSHPLTRKGYSPPSSFLMSAFLFKSKDVSPRPVLRRSKSFPDTSNKRRQHAINGKLNGMHNDLEQPSKPLFWFLPQEWSVKSHSINRNDKQETNRSSPSKRSHRGSPSRDRRNKLSKLPFSTARQATSSLRQDGISSTAVNRIQKETIVPSCADVLQKQQEDSSFALRSPPRHPLPRNDSETRARYFNIVPDDTTLDRFLPLHNHYQQQEDTHCELEKTNAVVVGPSGTWQKKRTGNYHNRTASACQMLFESSYEAYSNESAFQNVITPPFTITTMNDGSQPPPMPTWKSASLEATDQRSRTCADLCLDDDDDSNESDLEDSAINDSFCIVENTSEGETFDSIRSHTASNRPRVGAWDEVVTKNADISNAYISTELQGLSFVEDDETV